MDEPGSVGVRGGGRRDLYGYASNGPTTTIDPEGLAEIFIGVPVDAPTGIANWWNSWWVPNLELNRLNPDWEAAIQWLTTIRGNIGDVTISGHGGPGHVGPFNLQNINDPNSGAYQFLKALGQRSGKGGKIVIKSCQVAKGPRGLKFLIDLAKLTGKDVVGYTDWYAVTPHGDEIAATIRTGPLP